MDYGCGMKRLALAAAAAAIGAIGADACTAILVGKKASATGRVIVAHNEDNRPGTFMRYAFLPKREGAQAAFWSELKASSGPQTVAHLFLNESGVIVFSNNGGAMPEWGGVKYNLPEEGEYSTLTDGGKGYRLRCDMIEKARTAREGMEIMTDLVKRFGYTERSRLFTIADKDEIWVVQVLYGRRFVARRCPDDAVVAFPNCLIVNRLQPGDVASDNIVAKGKDFDFISFYQGPRTWKSLYNLYRWKDAYRLATGVDLEPGAEYPFSVKPAHKVSVDDIKRALATHYEGMPWEVKPNKHPDNNHTDVQPICRKGTLESMVCLMGETPKETVMHIAVGRPCETPYSVYRPLAGELPAGAATGEKALRRLRDYAKLDTPDSGL